MDIRHEVVTHARAKALISSYSERNGYTDTSREYHDFLSGLNVRRGRILCINRHGRLLHGVSPLADLIEKRRPTELYVYVVSDDEEVEDLFADIDLEPFPKIDGRES
jgi:hypothetical protein